MARGRVAPSWDGRGSWRCCRATRRGGGGTGAGCRGGGRARHGQVAAAGGIPPQSSWARGAVCGGTLSVLRGCHAVSAGAGPRAPALCDNPREQHEAIAAKVRRRLQAELDPDEGGPLLLHLLDIPAEMERLATAQPARAQGADLCAPPAPCLHEAQCHPCILTMENLHWSDATSEEWLTSLVERLASTALWCW